jgi:hypothetical protein
VVVGNSGAPDIGGEHGVGMPTVLYAPAGAGGASLARSGGASLARSGGASLARTGGASLARTGGASEADVVVASFAELAQRAGVTTPQKK